MTVVKNINIVDFDLIKESKNKKNVAFQKLINDMMEVSDFDSDDDIEAENKIEDKFNKNKPLSKADKEQRNLKNFMDLLPKKSKLTVSFELKETNADIANGIRRCILDEIDVVSFDFDEYKDIETDDRYILCDNIKKQLCLIPINQEYNYSDLNISLIKENLTDDIIDITTNDIVITANTGKAAEINKYDILLQNVIIDRLRPGRFLNIKNIYISTGNALKDAGKYSLVSNLKYEIMDVDPIIETDNDTTGISSMMSNPTHFKISYSTYRNIDKPLSIVVKCCDNLINRFNLIYDEMKKIKNTDVSYFSDLITLKSVENLKKIHITGEYWTVINLIVRYCYILTNGNIKFVTSALVHPEREIGVINITHFEFSTLIQNSIKKVIGELNIIRKAFL